MITKKDVLEALGREGPTAGSFTTGLLVGLGVGALVGGVAALLLAPRTGGDLRRAIGDHGRGLAERALGRRREVESTSPAT